MLKYRIEELRKQLPYEKARLVFNWLPQQLGITPKTMRDWRHLDIEDSRDIPAEKLFQIASFFSVDPVELFTEKPEPITATRPDFNANKIDEL